MAKPLHELTQEELWRLFPVRLSNHDPAWVSWYADESERLASALGSETVRVDHIGSTAVPGLIAKPVVDVLLQVEPNADLQDVTRALIADGWTVMARDSAHGEVDLCKGYTPDGYADKVFHLHVRRDGDWDEIHFRDYLAAHPDAVAEYEGLKRRLADAYEFDRDGYTAAKTDFVMTCVARARAERA